LHYHSWWMCQLIDSLHESHLEFVAHLYCPSDRLSLNQYTVFHVHHLTLHSVFLLTSNLPFKYLFSTITLYHMIILNAFNTCCFSFIKNKRIPKSYIIILTFKGHFLPFIIMTFFLFTMYLFI